MNAMVKGNRYLLIVLTVILVAALAIACGDDDGEDVSNFATDTATPAGAGGTNAPTDPPSQPQNCPAPITQAGEPDLTKKYDAKPEMTIDTSKTYSAVVKTERGDITLALRPDLAPEHVNSFVFLAREGFYDGVTFHRVEPGFVIQGGDPTGTGSGGPGYTLPGEFGSEPFVRGVLGMARTSDPNSAGSQWFITLGDAHHLDGDYTVFGSVTNGMDVVDCIQVGDGIVTIEVNE